MVACVCPLLNYASLFSVNKKATFLGIALLVVILVEAVVEVVLATKYFLFFISF